MADKFYTSRRWKDLRQAALRRDGFQCVRCRKYLRSSPATTVHHIQERERCPALQWELANLESLCRACHNKLHPEKGRSAGLRGE